MVTRIYRQHMSSCLHIFMTLTLTSIAAPVFAANVQIHVVVVTRIARVYMTICASVTTNKLAFVAKPDAAVATHTKREIRAALFVVGVLGFKHGFFTGSNRKWRSPEY